MTKLLLMLMIVGLGSGCGDLLMENPNSYAPTPWTGPEGQPIEEYYGKDREGNRIMYQYYSSGADTVKHGDYTVFYEDGPKRYNVNFIEGKRDGFETSFPRHEGCDTGKCREVEGKHDVDFWRDDKCVGTGPAVCEGDEYDGY